MFDVFLPPSVFLATPSFSDIRRWALNVECSMFPRFPGPQPSTLNPQPVRQRILDARFSQAHTSPMAKWEIRFQRFARSFRTSAEARLGVKGSP
jgi:hypothetical protein